MRLFGTDGVRGVANSELTPLLSMFLGMAVAEVLDSTNKVALIGKDTRESCDMLESAIAAGLMSKGFTVVRLGVVPTPAVAKLVITENAGLGVMISASHNPYEFNGIKFFNGRGYKLSDAIENKIEAKVKEYEAVMQNGGTLFGSESCGSLVKAKNLVSKYEASVKEIVERDGSNLSGLKIAVDTANGSLYTIATEVLSSLGAEVHVIGNAPDGQNINRNVGSTHLGSCVNYTLHTGADIGLSFDGDGDRLLICDELGHEYDGDAIALVLALDMYKKGQLSGNTVVATVMSNMGLEIALAAKNIKLVRTAVGDRYLLEEMLKSGYDIGAEQSGHVILGRYATTGDGLLTAVYLLSVLKKSGLKASEFFAKFEKMPQVMVNVKVPNDLKHQLLRHSEIADQVKWVESKYEGRGRVLIRPSGTEPLVRIMIEGKDHCEIQKDADLLASFIEDSLSK